MKQKNVAIHESWKSNTSTMNDFIYVFAINNIMILVYSIIISLIKKSYCKWKLDL